MADQNPGIASRLRAARVQQGLEIDALARELKNPRAVLEAIERGDWSRLGAPVFARHLVGRYASRLGVSVDLDQVVERVEAPVLRPQVSSTRWGRFADFSARHVAYAGGTLLVLPLVYLLLSGTASGPAQYRPLDPVATQTAPPVEASPASAGPSSAAPPDAVDPALAIDAEGLAGAASGEALADASAESTPAALPGPGPSAVSPPVVPAQGAPTPVAASLAGGVLPGVPQLEFEFSGDSWIEIFGRDGAVIERALARDGESRHFAAAEVGRVTIGNVDATVVVLDGSRVNLEAVRAANVARFALSSDGSIEAVSR